MSELVCIDEGGKPSKGLSKEVDQGAICPQSCIFGVLVFPNFIDSHLDVKGGSIVAKQGERASVGGPQIQTALVV
eukprot:532141-Amphidinium_carterae.1